MTRSLPVLVTVARMVTSTSAVAVIVEHASP